MSPFQEFRLWSRRAPAAERLAGLIGTALAVALLGWLLVPGDDGGDDATVLETSGTPAAAVTPSNTVAGDGTAGPTAGDGTAAGPTGTPSAGGSGAGGGSVASAGGGTAAATAGDNCPSGSATGVSATQVKLALGLTNIIGPVANSVFGIPTPEEQKVGFEAIIAGINGEGGIGCRKIVPQYFMINPVNQDELVQRCREISDAGVFAFADSGSYTTYPAVECFGQRKLPYFGGYFANVDRLTRNYPYLFNLNLLDTTYRNVLVVFKQRGTYSPQQGFKKLGFVFRDCDKPLVDATKKWVREAAGEGNVVEYSVGCPTVLANPADLSAAVLTFQRAGATHVFTLGMLGDMSNLTSTAQQQNYKPKWTLADDGIVSISYGSQAPDPDNMADALLVTTNRGGEERTPGMRPTPGTLHCDKYLAAKRLAPTWRQGYAVGNMCNQLWMIKAAVETAGVFKQDALAAGLAKARTIDFSYPQAPPDFAAVPKTTTGGQTWRMGQFYRDCSCWKITEPDFKPINR